MSTALLIQSKNRGPINLPDREYGQVIAMAVKSLDRIAESMQLPTIDSFVYVEPEMLQDMMTMANVEAASKMQKRLDRQKEWSLPSQAMETIRQLKAYVADASSTGIEFSVRQSSDHLRQALIEDLQIVESILKDLADSNDLFRFEAA